MMKYLELFIVFFKIGAFAFGGGYGMIPVIRQEVLSHGWLDDDSLLEMIAVSESSPGPVSVNLATFVGSERAGVLGSFLATLGVILPAFIIMLIVSKIFTQYQNNKIVQSAFTGIKPTVCGMILATGLVLTVKSLLPGLIASFELTPSMPAAITAALLAAEMLVYKKIKGKSLSPALLIGSSAVLGVVVNSL